VTKRRQECQLPMGTDSEPPPAQMDLTRVGGGGDHHRTQMDESAAPRQGCSAKVALTSSGNVRFPYLDTKHCLDAGAPPLSSPGARKLVSYRLRRHLETNIRSCFRLCLLPPMAHGAACMIHFHLNLRKALPAPCQFTLFLGG
jgi:hypothetical protein